MSLCRSRGVGQYVAGETHNIIAGRLGKPGAPGVLALTGSHSLADSELTGDALARVTALAESGFVVMSADQGQTPGQGTYGNDTIITRIGLMKTYLQASGPTPAAPGKVAITGGSGGATAALNYALRNPANVAALYLMCPVTDLNDFYTNRTDATITKAEIDAAYGGSAAFTAALPSHSPIAQSLTPIAGIPVRIAYSTNDPYIPVATVMTFSSALVAAGGSISMIDMGAVGHGTTGLDPYDVVRFLQAHP